MSDIFSSWGLSSEVMKSIDKIGYKEPTPVQAAVIPHLLQNRGDLLALAKTGTGKTAAFGIPLAEQLERTPALQALVLCPTRELANQVSGSLQALAVWKGLKVATVVGGESYRRQIDALRAGPQILVSTPGRLIDLMEQGAVKLKDVKTLILDEADEMLSFGFQDALETVWKSLDGNEAKTWLFSATMSESIRRLTSKYLKTPHIVSLNTTQEPSRVESFAAVVFEEDKEDALALLIQSDPNFYGIVFAQTKRQVSEMEIRYRAMGLKVDSLHGDKVQADRARVLGRLKSKEVRILIATDVAARGLDIQDLTHVVNFELPWDVETYTHRIGRTARAGKAGTVWTFVKPKESHNLRKFERSLKFEFKPLVIPTVDQVRQKQIKNWLDAVKNTEVKTEQVNDLKALMFDMQMEEEMVLTPQTQEWLTKVIEHLKIGKSSNIKTPRSFDLRPRTDAPRFNDDRRGGGDRGGYAPRGRGGFDRRSDDRGGGYRGASAPRRTPDDAGTSAPRAAAPRTERSEGGYGAPRANRYPAGTDSATAKTASTERRSATGITRRPTSTSSATRGERTMGGRPVTRR